MQELQVYKVTQEHQAISFTQRRHFIDPTGAKINKEMTGLLQQPSGRLTVIYKYNRNNRNRTEYLNIVHASQQKKDNIHELYPQKGKKIPKHELLMKLAKKANYG